MSFKTKAIIAALALSLTPAIASAQSYGHGLWGGGTGVPHINGIARPVQGGMPNPGQQPNSPNPGVIGIPVQAQDCGASQLQWLLGQPLSVAQDLGITARYFSPERMVGTMDWQPGRLNISANEHYIIYGVSCG